MTDPEQQRQFAVEVVRRLREAGFAAYWAGGCVRDELLGRRPKDYDVATSATPPQIRALFGQRRTLPLGAAFGVITVLGPRPAGQIEVATFRQDAAYSDGRHPDHVTFSSAEEDAKRRDFTINGMFFDPIAREVVDYVGGQEDLRQGRIRAIGSPRLRIEEDKLRMLRAVRFAAVFGFAIDTDTANAIRAMAGEITVVSPERIAMEMRRVLTEAGRVEGMRLLIELGLATAVLPEVNELSPEEFEHALDVLGRLNQPGFPLALAAVLAERGRRGSRGGTPLETIEQGNRRGRMARGASRRFDRGACGAMVEDSTAADLHVGRVAGGPARGFLAGRFRGSDVVPREVGPAARSARSAAAGDRRRLAGTWLAARSGVQAHPPSPSRRAA